MFVTSVLANVQVEERSCNEVFTLTNGVFQGNTPCLCFSQISKRARDLGFGRVFIWIACSHVLCMPVIHIHCPIVKWLCKICTRRTILLHFSDYVLSVYKLCSQPTFSCSLRILRKVPKHLHRGEPMESTCIFSSPCPFVFLPAYEKIPSCLRTAWNVLLLPSTIVRVMKPQSWFIDINERTWRDELWESSIASMSAPWQLSTNGVSWCERRCVWLCVCVWSGL